MISVILPTYNEGENITSVIQQISHVLVREKVHYEIIVIDDNSPDDTARIASDLENEYPVRTFIRKKDRGLSKSVIKGFELARGEICVVMDADLSHPVERIPAMIGPIVEDRCDATVGSRYLSKEGFGDFSLIRKVVSKFAGFLAKGVTDIKDRTSGFMAIRRSLVQGVDLIPPGGKSFLRSS